MEENLKTLYELCETLDQELKESNEKIRKAGGKLSTGDLDVIDKLTHALKSVKTTIAMIEAEDDEKGYSGRYMPYYGRSYRREGHPDSYGGMSSVSRRPARRDNMGRYSGDGYSYHDSMTEIIEDMRGVMDSLPDEKRREVQRFVDKMERM